GVATGVAHPVAVHRGVEPGDDAVGLFVLVVELDGASRRAAHAGGVGGAQLPGADLEAEVLGGEGAYRADVHHVHRVGIVQPVTVGDVDRLTVAAPGHRQLGATGDLLAEANAPRAQDAALGVQH